jgi:hypothetical protein
MESLNFGPYLPYVLFFIGISCMLIPLFYKSNIEKLTKAGVRCEGIIFQLGYKDNFTVSADNSVKDKITIRFVTQKKEWITEDLNTNFMISWAGQYKVGEKISVIYNPDNPSEFTVETKQSQTVGKLMMFIIGVVFVGAGVYELFKQA